MRIEEGTDSSADSEFLMELMEINEALDEARTPEAANRIGQDAKGKQTCLFNLLSERLLDWFLSLIVDHKLALEDECNWRCHTIRLKHKKNILRMKYHTLGASFRPRSPPFLYLCVTVFKTLLEKERTTTC